MLFGPFDQRRNHIFGHFSFATPDNGFRRIQTLKPRNVAAVRVSETKTSTATLKFDGAVVFGQPVIHSQHAMPARLRRSRTTRVRIEMGNVMPIVKVTQQEARQAKGVTDAEKLRQKTDEEIEQAARNDPDSALPTEEQLQEFKRRPRAEKND